jgi:hypothetical protein
VDCGLLSVELVSENDVAGLTMECKGLSPSYRGQKLRSRITIEESTKNYLTKLLIFHSVQSAETEMQKGGRYSYNCQTGLGKSVINEAHHEDVLHFCLHTNCVKAIS